MSKTEHLGLNLTTDESTKFSDWRKSIDGEDGSNMQIIDQAFGQVTDQVQEAIHYTSNHEERIGALESAGGGGTQWYRHELMFDDNTGCVVAIISTQSTPYTNGMDLGSGYNYGWAGSDIIRFTLGSDPIVKCTYENISNPSDVSATYETASGKTIEIGAIPTYTPTKL